VPRTKGRVGAGRGGLLTSLRGGANPLKQRGVPAHFTNTGGRPRLIRKKKNGQLGAKGVGDRKSAKST